MGKIQEGFHVVGRWSRPSVAAVRNTSSLADSASAWPPSNTGSTGLTGNDSTGWIGRIARTHHGHRTAPTPGSRTSC